MGPISAQEKWGVNTESITDEGPTDGRIKGRMQAKQHQGRRHMCDSPFVSGGFRFAAKVRKSAKFSDAPEPLHTHKLPHC